MWQVSLAQSSGDVRYRVDWTYFRAGKAANESIRVWMLWTSGYGVSASDMLGGEYVRSCERDMSYLWREVTGSVSDGLHATVYG